MPTDTPFLTHSLKEIDYYIKFFKSNQYPFYAALVLDSNNVKLSDILKQNLLDVAKRDFRLETINEVLKTIANNGYK